MKEFNYTMTDPLGLHARPAARLARTAQVFDGTVITVEKEGRTVQATQLLRLMGLGLRQGDVVRVRAQGAQEASAIAAMEAFFRAQL